jgi:hypothetical protein
VRRRLAERFKIDFREVDPATDFFLGSNRISLDRDSATLKGTSYIEQMVVRYLGSLEALNDTKKYPASWSYTPSDPAMMKDWEEAVATKPKASKEFITVFMKEYGSLYGSLLYATKFRGDICATMGLAGTCLTFPPRKCTVG